MADEMFILRKEDGTDHLHRLERILEWNIEGYFYGKTKMEYLGLWVTHNRIKPINKKNRSNKKYDAIDFLKRKCENL